MDGKTDGSEPNKEASEKFSLRHWLTLTFDRCKQTDGVWS